MQMVELGIFKLEDLWRLVATCGFPELLEWHINQGADMNYRIPGRHNNGDFETVLLRFTKYEIIDFVEFLLVCGVDVNAPPSNNHPNYLHYLVTAHKFGYNALEDGASVILPLTAKGTDNLFTPFIYGCFTKFKIDDSDEHSIADTVISQELLNRHVKLIWLHLTYLTSKALLYVTWLV